MNDLAVICAAGGAARRASLGAVVLRAVISLRSGSRIRAAEQAIFNFAQGASPSSADDQELRRVARAVLVRLQQARCPVCRGVRFQTHQGSPRLTNAVCPACRGTGLHHAARVPLTAQGEAVCERVFEKLEAFERGIARRLRT